MRVGRNVHVLHRDGVDARVVHAGADRAGRRVKILHLLGHIAQIADKFRQLHRLLHPAARMGRHQIGNQILFFIDFLVDPAVAAGKLLIYPVGRLSHLLQDGLGHMLRRYLQLTADMVAAQLLQERIILICQHIVEAQP